jgi:hypothetical protein
MGVEVGVGVDVAVLLGVGGTGVEVGGIGVEDGVGVGVDMVRGVGDGCIAVAVSVLEPCTTADRGRESLASRATKTPATKLRIGTTTQPFPEARLLMPCHQSHRQSAVLLCAPRRERDVPSVDGSTACPPSQTPDGLIGYMICTLRSCSGLTMCVPGHGTGTLHRPRVTVWQVHPATCPFLAVRYLVVYNTVLVHCARPESSFLRIRRTEWPS